MTEGEFGLIRDRDMWRVEEGMTEGEFGLIRDRDMWRVVHFDALHVLEVGRELLAVNDLCPKLATRHRPQGQPLLLRQPVDVGHVNPSSALGESRTLSVVGAEELVRE